MKRALTFFLLIVLCLGTTATLSVGPFAATGLAAGVDDPYTQTFTEAYLKSLPQSSGHYTCCKASSPYTYFEQDWLGVDLQYLLESEVGILSDTTAIRIQSNDGYTVDLTLDQMRGNGNVRGLKTLLAYQRGAPSVNNYNAPDGDGAPWLSYTGAATVLDGTEGPFRLAVPQTGTEGPIPGNTAYTSPAGTGTAANWGMSAKWVTAIEVLPLPAGMTELTLTELGTLYAAGEVEVYGNIHPVTITGLSPDSGVPGTEVTISGSGFGDSQGTSCVSFGSETAAATSWSDSEIKCDVPVIAAGDVQVTVTTPEWTSNGWMFTVGSYSTITATAGTGGSIDPSGDVYVAGNGSQTFTITPDSGYHVLDVEVDGVPVGAVTSCEFTDVTADHTIDATFSVSFDDEFAETTLDPGWTWTDPLDDCGYSLTDNPGYLRVSVPGSGHDLSSTNTDAPRVTQPVSGNFIAETRVLADPQYDYDGAGILVWADSDNYFRLERGLSSYGQGAYYCGMVGGGWSFSGFYSFIGTTTYLRLAREGNTFYGYCSNDGITWNLVGSVGMTVSGPIGVGLDVADQWTAYPFSADFDYFHVNRQFVNASVSGGHGTATPSSQTAVRGKSAAVALDPDDHYHVASVTDNGVAVTPTPTSSCTITPVVNNHDVVVTYAIDSFKITASAGSNGSISPSGEVSVEYGASKSFTITPDAGYFVEDVLVDGLSAGRVTSYEFTGVDTDHTIEASFATSFSDEFSTDTLDPGWTWTDPLGDCSCSLTAEPGYLRIGVPGNMHDLWPGTNYNAPRVTQPMAGDFFVETRVLFSPVYYTEEAGILVWKDSGNFIRLERGSGDVARCVSVVGGTEATMSASSPTADTYLRLTREGDDFYAYYSGDGLAWSLLTSVVMAVTDPVQAGLFVVEQNQDDAISADFDYFRCGRHFVNASVSEGHGTATPATQVVSRGGSATVTLTPDPHYHVSSVTDNGSVVIPTPTSSYTINPVVNNHNVVVTYAIDSFTLSTGQVGSGMVSKNPSLASYDYGASVQVTATPDSGNHFVEWSGDLTGSANPADLTMDANKTAIAHFAINTYTIAASADPSAGGSVGGEGSYDHGDTVDLTATPATGYHFVNWTENGTEVSTSADYSFTATANRTLVAHFAIDTFTITSSVDGGHGSIAPLGGNVVFYGGSQTYTITPAAHYHVADVLVDGVSVGAVASYGFSGVTDDHTIVASFALDTFTITSSVVGADGTISPLGDTVVGYGGSQAYAITPDDGYRVLVVVVDGVSVGAVDSYEFTNVTADHEIVVSFAHDRYTFYFAEGYTGADSFDEWLCLMNPGDAAVAAHITYMFADGTTQEQIVTVGATSRVTVNVNSVVGADKDVSVMITSSSQIVAERPMYFNYGGAWTGGHDVIGATAPGTSFYFAEGYTGADSFAEYLCLMNPGETGTTAHITYMFADGTTQARTVDIRATSRATVNVNNDVGPDKDVSVKITSDGPIVAERPMYFNYGGVWTGGHDVIGLAAPRTSFYFAEGYTGAGTFDEYLCLMNPGSAGTTAHVTYMFDDGTTQEQAVDIGATSRVTVKVNDVVGADKNVSVMITSDDPIVAERPMYFNYSGAWTGGHDVIGAVSPQDLFYFAEGYTGAGTFDEYLCLMNPGDAAVDATITYMFADGTTQEQTVSIGATSRTTVNVNSVVGADKDVSVMITSDGPIVAERPMYFNYSGAWTGGHDVVGFTP